MSSSPTSSTTTITQPTQPISSERSSSNVTYLSPAPSYTCPFPSKSHSQLPFIVSHVQSYFLTNWPFLSPLEKQWYQIQDFEACCCYIIPEAPMDRAIKASMWYVAVFLLDDMLEGISGDEKASKASSILQGLVSGTKLPSKASTLQRIIYEAHQGFLDVEDDRSKKLGKEVLKECVKWMKCALSSATKNKDYKPESLEEYIKWRKGNLGTWVFLYTLRWAYKIYLPPSILSCPSMIKFEEKAITHTLFVNDLYSFRKEVKEAEKAGISVEEMGFDNAMVYFMRGGRRLRSGGLQIGTGTTRERETETETETATGRPEETGMTEEQATEEILKCLHRAEVEVFSAVEGIYASAEFQEEDETTKKEIRRYVDGVLLTLGSHVEWSKIAGRYNKTTDCLENSVIRD